jgi:YVTN family beta-propeller protein
MKRSYSAMFRSSEPQGTRRSCSFSQSTHANGWPTDPRAGWRASHRGSILKRVGASGDEGLPSRGARPASEDVSNVPTGTDVHAFLIADVRGWTSFTQARGDEEAGRLAARFAEVAREVIRGHQGEVLELRGDEAMCVFGSPRSAISAAVALQQRFVEETIADPSLPLTVGVGLDAGEAVPVEGGYRGGALNVAARLCSRARAGEVLASGEIVHLARRIDGIRFTERGKADMKGLDQPVHVVAVRAEAADTVEAIAPFVRSTAQAPALHRRRNVIAAVIAFLLIAALVAVPLARRSGGSSQIAPNSIGVLDPESGELSSTIAMPSRPGAITSSEGSLWVTSPDADVVTRIDQGTKTVINTTRVGHAPAAISADEGAVWVVNSAGPTVSRISPDTNEVEGDPIGVGNGPADIATGEGAVWVTNRFDGSVSRIDPSGGEVKKITVGLDPSGIAVGFGSVWVALAGSNEVVRVDPETNKVVQPIDVGNVPGALAISPDAVWVVNSLANTVSRIDPNTNLEVEAIQVGDGPSDIAYAEGAIWVANESDGTLSRIDFGSKTTRTVGVGSIPSGLESAGGSLWVTVRGTATSHLGGTLRLVSQDDPGTIDPVESLAPWPLLIVMGDGLVGFKRVGGFDGGTLVPDLALSLPTLTDDGKTYRFQLRPGIKYSNGEPVMASDFSRAIERGFRIQDPLTTFSYFGRLVGGRACKEIPASCNLSEGIVSDDQAGTITFHLSKRDPDFLHNLALPMAFPVPPSTPIDEEQIRAGVPGTGPYMLEGPMTRDGLVLVRNEYFHEWSAEAQPDGNVDRIEWTFGGRPVELADAVAKGESDYLVAGDHPPSGIDDLRVEFPAQVHEHPRLGLLYLSLNTKLPPFNDKDVRRALNFAVDRQRIVDLYGGSAAAHLTCQILPPNFPGYEPYCPYTVGPGPGGQWTGPDMEEAQRLVRRSGTAETHVTFWYSPAFPGHPQAQAKYFVNLLKELHFDVDLRSTAGSVDWRHDPGAAYRAHFGALSDPGREIQIAPAGWLADYPSASDFTATLLRCDLFPDPNYGGFCDRDIDRMMEDAAQIPTEDPASGQAWAEVDHAITDEAPFVSLLNGVQVDFVSSRLENYQYNPVWGLLLDQVWVQ